MSLPPESQPADHAGPLAGGPPLDGPLQAAGFQALWAVTPDALVLADGQGRVLAANPAYHTLCGYPPAEVIGHDLALIFPPAARPAARAAYHAGFTQADPPAMQIQTLQHRDGSTRLVEWRTTVLRAAAGPPTALALLREVTARLPAADAPAESTRLLTFSAAVGLALVQHESLPAILGQCTQALVTHLGAAFARIWTLTPTADVLELQASAGLYTHLDGAHSRVVVGQFKIGRIAATRRPHLTNTVAQDREVQDRAWAAREGLIAFAGYPLLVDDRLVGVMALFARRPLTPATLDAMAAVASSVALGIARKQAEVVQARLTAAAEHDRARLQDLFEQVPAAVALYRGPHFIIEFANPGAGAGTAQRPQPGLPLLEAVPELRGSATYAALAAVYQSGTPQITPEARLLLDHTGTGRVEERFFYLVTQPTRDFSGNVDGVLSFAMDITEQVQTRRQVEVLAEERRQALHLRDEFLSMAAHELKTPLTSLKALAQLLVRRSPTEASARVVRGLQSITTQVDRMAALVNELLDLARLERGLFEPQRAPLDLGALISEVIDQVQILSDTHPMHLDPPPAPIIVAADGERLRQVLVNLLENAVKYSPAGGPVTIRVGHTAARAYITVQDQGMGIPADQVAHIFERFYRAGNARTAPISGLGLGLHISHAIVAQHGGNLTVTSAEGQGSTFTVELPL